MHHTVAHFRRQPPATQVITNFLMTYRMYLVDGICSICVGFVTLGTCSDKFVFGFILCVCESPGMPFTEARGLMQVKRIPPRGLQSTSYSVNNPQILLENKLGNEGVHSIFILAVCQV